jgi:acetyltransferase-like isoleucine patch superfamily enzyme
MIQKIIRRVKWILRKPIDKAIQICLSRKYGSIGIGTRILGEIWTTEPKNIFIGKMVKIGPLCRLETFSHYGNTITKPRMIISDFVSLQHAVHIYCNQYLEIQDGVLIASGCMITDNNHGINPLGSFYVNQPLSGAPTIIKKGAWLGENVAVLAGSTIGERSIIGANSVVKGDIPDYCIAAGNPARVIKRYNFASAKWEKAQE